jgi:U4/U6 small nuclear ribonucleoprotein PRP31
MSLADALLADFDGLSDDGGLSDHEDTAPQASSSTSANNASGSGSGNKDSPFGSMGPPPLPTKAIAGQKRLAAALDGGFDEDDDMDGEEDMKLEGGQSAVGFVPEGGIKPAEELDADEVEDTDMTNIEDVGKISKLLSGKRLKETVEVCSVMFACGTSKWLTSRTSTSTLATLQTCHPTVVDLWPKIQNTISSSMPTT